MADFKSSSEYMINVKSPTGETKPMTIEKSYSGRDLKNIILGNKKKTLFLRVNGIRLNDEDNLMANVVKGGTVVAHEGIEICVRFPDQLDIYLTVDPHESVPNLKALIELKKGIPQAEQILLYSGTPLENCVSLWDYKIPNRTTLLLQRINPLPSTITVNISMVGTSFSLVVQPSDTIEIVKAKICAKIQLKLNPDQVIDLIFGGNCLSDRSNRRPLTLEDHKVQDSSQLFAFISYLGG